MLSQDVAAFMDAFREELDVGQIAVVPFDDGGEVTVILPFSPGLAWFAGLASEAAAAR
jgi:hypothetical protein